MSEELEKLNAEYETWKDYNPLIANETRKKIKQLGGSLHTGEKGPAVPVVKKEFTETGLFAMRKNEQFALLKEFGVEKKDVPRLEKDRVALILAKQ